jgi:hypothetical protein
VRTGWEELDIYIDPGEINPLTRVRFSGYSVQGLTLKVRNVVVLRGAVKVYVAAVDELRKRERQDETQFSLPQNNRWFSEFHPSLMLMYFLFFLQVFFLNLIS